MDSCYIQQCFNCTACNYPGTLRCRPQKNLSGTFFSNNRMVNAAGFRNRYFDKVFLCIIKSFLNGISNFICFAQSVSGNTFSITYYNNRIETKSAPALYNFRDPVNVNKFLFQV